MLILILPIVADTVRYSFKTIPDDAFVAIRACVDAMERCHFPPCGCPQDSIYFNCSIAHMRMTARSGTPYPLPKRGLEIVLYHEGVYNTLAPQLDGLDLFATVQHLVSDRSSVTSCWPPPRAFFSRFPDPGTVYTLRRGGPDDALGLYATRNILPGEIIAPYYSNVSPAADYASDARNGYEELRTPRPFVVFVDGVALDARVAGSEARFIRHSCTPNTAVVPALVAGAYTFVVVALTWITDEDHGYGGTRDRAPVRMGRVPPNSPTGRRQRYIVGCRAPCSFHVADAQSA